MTVIAATASSIRAQVRGSRRSPYTVCASVPDPGQPVLGVSCDCPYASDDDPCKHIWAVLLAWDARQRGQRIAGRGEIEVIVDDPMDHELEERADEPAPPASDRGWRLDDEAADADHWDDEDDDDHGADMDAGDPSTRRSWRDGLTPLELAARAERHAVADATGRLEYHLDARHEEQAGGADTLTVAFVWRPRRRDGTLGTAQPQLLDSGRIAALSPEDRRLVVHLRALGRAAEANTYYRPYYQSHYQAVPRRLALSMDFAEPMLRLLAATGKLYISRWTNQQKLEKGQELRPLRWDGDEPYELALVIEPDGGKGSVRARGVLIRGDERIDLEACRPWTDQLFAFGDRLLRATSHRRWWAFLRERPRVTARELSGFMSRLAALPDLPVIECAAPSASVGRAPPPRPIARCEAPEHGGATAKIGASVSFAYGAREIAARDPASGVWDRDAAALDLRDRATEAALVAELCAAGFAPAAAPDRDAEIAARDFPEAVRALLARGWHVEAEGKIVRAGRSMSLRVSSGIDWFDVSAEAVFDGGAVDPEALFAALSRRSRWVTLADGSSGLLPEEWIAKLAPLAEHGLGGGSLRFSRVQGLLLDAWLADREIDADAGFTRFRRELRRFERIAPRKAPRSFRGTLRPYQQLGLGWLTFLERFGLGGCLADDMGLGKTVQVLALLAAGRRRGEPGPRASLVVAPRSLVFNWRDEAARFTPKLRVLDYRGPARHDELPHLDDYDLVLTTYGTLRRDILDLKEHRFRYAILDEATAIKNASSQIAKACRLIDAGQRLALTGTPVENSLLDLASIMDFLNPGLIANSTALQALAAADPSADQKSALARVLRPVLLRRTKEQVLADLPQKTEQTLYCRLDHAQRKLYDSIRDAYRRSLEQRIAERGLGQAKIHVLEALLRLRQAACHPGLLDRARASEHSAKLEELFERLEEVVGAGHKALVFSQFTSFLAIVRARLDQSALSYAYLDGSTTRRDRVVRQFQDDPKCAVFLISLKAGGHGLNLTAADYVFLLDPWWNPAVEAQAIDRSHRLGQTRPVFAYRLVAEDTVEDKILALQQKKRDLASGIFASDESLIASLDARDLAELFS